MANVQRCPDFFIVGAPKCGTTAMHEFLRRHPGVFMPQCKELHFFGSDLSDLRSQMSPEGHAWLFAQANGEKCVGETCIWALYSTRAAEEIKQALPGARIVIMLREPVEMMYALHSEYLYQRLEDIRDFGRAVAAEADRKRGLRLPANNNPAKILFYREVASFAAQVQRYIDVFGRNNVHVILFDDFRRDLPAVYRRLLEFLGVNPEFQTTFEVIWPNRRVRSSRLRDLLERPPSVLHRLARALVPAAGLRQKVCQGLQRWNVVFAPRPPLEIGLRRRLQEELADDVRRLSGLLGRDLSTWLS